jgi:hypothetical protein
MPDYIPSNEDGFQTWGLNFANTISGNPPQWMLTAAQALSIQNAVDDFVAKKIIANTELTRNKQTIADKDDARSIAETMCRQYAMMIKDNIGITDGDKLLVGVRPINPDRENIDPPSTQPLLNILGNTPGIQTVVYADTTTPDSKAKAPGATSLQLFRGIGTEENLPVSQCQFYGAMTRNPIDVEFDEDDDGKISTFYARWANAKGEVGPFSLPISMRIAA